MNFINHTVNTENINQTTLKNKVIFSGIGIHNGKAVTMSVEPAEINTGIVFERLDIKNKNTEPKKTIQNKTLISNNFKEEKNDVIDKKKDFVEFKKSTNRTDYFDNQIDLIDIEQNINDIDKNILEIPAFLRRQAN